MKVRLQDGEVCLLQDAGERVISSNSVATCSATWFVYPFSAATSYAPIVNVSAHPIWTGLYCKSVAIKKRGKGAIITAQYEGAEAEDALNTASDRTVEVSVTMREEPIESHPDFEEWAGTPQNPKSGIFDADGKFTGWSSKTEVGKDMAGVKSYLVPSYSGTISYISKGKPSLGGIGKIGSSGGLPSVGGKYQWMRTGVSFSSMSDGKYKVTETYLLSGPNGWNKWIYS